MCEMDRRVGECGAISFRLGALVATVVSIYTPNRMISIRAFLISLILSQVSHEWAFCVIVLDLPKYMNDVLHFSIQDNGIYSSIPQLIKLIMALVTGVLNDWLIAKNHLSITGGRKVFVGIGE